MLLAVVSSQKFRAGSRGERNAALQLGVVTVTGAMPCICPTVIEDVFTLAMILQVERHHAKQIAAVLNSDMERLPSGVASYTAALFQGEQESVSSKGVVGPSAIGAAIPFPGVYLGNAVADFRSRRWQLRSRLEDRAMIRTQTARKSEKSSPGDYRAAANGWSETKKYPSPHPEPWSTPETHTPAGLWHWGCLWRSVAAARR